jgi:hypothetical protein
MSVFSGMVKPQTPKLITAPLWQLPSETTERQEGAMTWTPKIERQ